MKDLLINLVNKIYQDKMYIGCIIEINNDEHLICGLPISSNLLENNDTLGVLICKIPLIYCIFNDTLLTTNFDIKKHKTNTDHCLSSFDPKINNSNDSITL